MVWCLAKACAGRICGVVAAIAIAALLLLSPQAPLYAAEPIKVGFSMAMTGGWRRTASSF